MEDNDRLAKIRDLKPGDMVDLEGDPFADPNHDEIQLQYEYIVVDHVREETPGCWLLEGGNVDFLCGFPPDHEVVVGGHNTDYEEVGP